MPDKQRNEPKKPDEHPIHADELRAMLNEHAGAPLYLCEGQYNPSPLSKRLLGFRRKATELTALFSVWLAREDYDRIADWPGLKISLGKCDAMYATAPGVLWFADEDTFEVYNAAEEEFKRGLSLGRADAEKYRAVHCFVSDDWVRRGVRLVYTAGNERIVARDDEAMAGLDPTYDGIDLMMDAAWVTDLGGDLAKFLNVELKIDEALA